MLNPLQGTSLSLPKLHFLAYQHPSGGKVIEKLLPAPMKDPCLDYLGVKSSLV